MRLFGEELPDYAWASVEPAAIGLSHGPWAKDLPAVARVPVREDLPDAPTDHALGELRPVAHPRVRVLGAYWHEGWPHAVPGAWLRPAALRRLLDAVGGLPMPFGLAVWDAWRDPALQAVLHDRVYQDSTLAPGFVAYPDPDPRKCPPHASGGTVDLTLTWRGHPLSLGTRFDAFVPQAASDALEPGGGHVRGGVRAASPGMVALGVRDPVLVGRHRKARALRSCRTAGLNSAQPRSPM
jgi:hypothetical protein